jgi:plasmid maintenance system antidote protein VapI
LLAVLRDKLGDLQQDDIARRLGIHPRTVQNIELGKRKLTRAMAERIGDTFDVDPECLIANDLAKGLKTRDGRAWTAKVRLEIRDRLLRWGELEPYARQGQRRISASLLRQYLQISHLIGILPDSEQRFKEWTALFELAYGALLWSQPIRR